MEKNCAVCKTHEVRAFDVLASSDSDSEPETESPAAVAPEVAPRAAEDTGRDEHAAADNAGSEDASAVLASGTLLAGSWADTEDDAAAPHGAEGASGADGGGAWMGVARRGGRGSGHGGGATNDNAPVSPPRGARRSGLSDEDIRKRKEAAKAAKEAAKAKKAADEARFFVDARAVFSVLRGADWTPSGHERCLILVGAPGSGKSTVSHTLRAAGWAIVNQDTLKSRKACEKGAHEALAAGGRVVVDRCNFDATQRRHFVAVARENGLAPEQVGAVFLDVPRDVCEARVLSRADHPTLEAVPESVGIVRKMHGMLRAPADDEGLGFNVHCASDADLERFLSHYRHASAGGMPIPSEGGASSASASASASGRGSGSGSGGGEAVGGASAATSSAAVEVRSGADRKAAGGGHTADTSNDWRASGIVEDAPAPPSTTTTAAADAADVTPRAAVASVRLAPWASPAAVGATAVAPNTATDAAAAVPAAPARTLSAAAPAWTPGGSVARAEAPES